MNRNRHGLPALADPPRLDAWFWLFHVLGWSVFIITNIAMRVVASVESLEHAIVSGVILLIINTAICLLYRVLIHWLRRARISRIRFWFSLALLAVIFGFASSSLILLCIGLYYILMDYSSTLVFFMTQVYGNWMIMTILIMLWGVIYSTICAFRDLKQSLHVQSELELQLKQSEMDLLTGQLNPHFLFNALNNIRGLMLEDISRARQMITNLSGILRYSLLSLKQQLQSLQQELDVVHSYIELAGIQYEDRLQFTESIGVDPERCHVPPMLIQLLVENAIRHGIDRAEQGGELSLQIRQRGDELEIVVANPGQLDSNTAGTGLGLKNIRQRLQLLFDDRASCLIQPRGGQIEVRVTMPMIQEVPM